MKMKKKQDLSHFLFFFHVAKHRSFSIAAKKMNVSRSSVMSHIKNLEERFNIRFINRNTRFFSLTFEGKYLYEQSLKLDALLEETVKSLENVSSFSRKEVSIKLPVIFDIPDVHYALSSFMNKNPEIVVHTRYDDRLGNLIEEEIDFAVHIGELPNCSYYSKIVTNFKSHILASPEYVRTHGEPLHPQNLVDHKCINFEHCITGNKWLFRDKTKGILESYALGPTLKVSSERTVISFAEKGMGIGSGLSFLCHEKIKSNRLQSILSEWTYPIPVYIIFHSKCYVDEHIRNLMDEIKDTINLLQVKNNL